MDQDGQAPGAAPVADAVLLGAHAPLHHGVHPLEVAGVEGQRDVHPPAGGHPVAGVAQVVLHVAARVAAQVGGAVEELGEDLRRRLAQHVGQHVEAAPVGHADDDLGDARRATTRSMMRSRMGMTLSAPSSEKRLAPRNLVCRKCSNTSASVTLASSCSCSARVSLTRLRVDSIRVLQPGAQLVAVDVGELDADVAAVGLLEQVDQLAQRAPARPGRSPRPRPAPSRSCSASP